MSANPQQVPRLHMVVIIVLVLVIVFVLPPLLVLALYLLLIVLGAVDESLCWLTELIFDRGLRRSRRRKGDF